MKYYLKEIKKYSPLDREEERTLIKRAKEGDEWAREKVIKCNLRFVVSIAKNYANQGLSLEDLIGEGNYGLIQALDRFDLEYKNKFITYAVWWIRHYIFQAISAANSGSVKLPTNKQQLLSKLVKTRDRLEQKYQREPTDDEIEKELGLKITDLFNIGHNYLSLDNSYLDDGGAPLQDILPDDRYDPNQDLIDDRLSEDIEDLINSIPNERERIIIKFYHGLNLVRSYTLEEIGSMFGISRERVRQIKEKTLEKISKNPKFKYLKQHLEE